MKNEYKNLWYQANKQTMKPVYFNDAPLIKEYRGVQVFKLYNGSYDFVLKGACITQRAGVARYKEVIDGILDGTDLLTGTAVTNYLKEVL